MREIHSLLVSLVLAVMAVWLRLTPDARMRGSQTVSAAVAGIAVGVLIMALIKSAGSP